MMAGPFYKALKVLLADTNLSPAAKLVRIVRTHFLSFEGREATVREIAVATGLGERTVRRFLAAKLAEGAANLAAKMAGKTAKLAASPLSFRDGDKGEREDQCRPLLETPQGTEKKKAVAAAPTSLGRRLAGRTVGLIRERTSEEEWEAFAEETIRRLGRTALTAFLAFHEHLVFWPRELSERVEAWWREERRRRWDERLRQIREGNLKTAEPILRPKDDREPPSKDRRYRVRWADDGVLAIERQTLVRGRWEWDGQAYRSEYRAEDAERAGRAWRLLPDGALLPGVEW